jgi:hypothetical protein
MSGFESAVLSARARAGADQPFSFVARTLLSLLRKYSTGLSEGIVADEICFAVEKLGAGRCPPPTDHTLAQQTFANSLLTLVTPVTPMNPTPFPANHIPLSTSALVRSDDQSGMPFDSSVWTGTVRLTTSGETPAYIVDASPSTAPAVKAAANLPERGSAPVFALCVHSSLRHVHVLPGATIRLVPNVLRNDPCRRFPISRMPRGKDGRSERLDVCLLPTRHIVFGIVIPQNDSSAPSYPPDARALLEKHTLQHVWQTRSMLPPWVSGLVVDVTPDAIRIQDVDAVGSSQPTVLLVLNEGNELYADLVCVHDFLLIREPSVSPTGNSFELGFSSTTVVYALNHCSASVKVGGRIGLSLPTCPDSPITTTKPSTGQKDKEGPSIAATCVATPPPTKRQRLPVKVTDLDPHLAMSTACVTTADVVTLANPAGQPAFDMLAVASRRPRMTPIPAADRVDTGDGHILMLKGGLFVRLFGSRVRKDAVLRIGPGHILWLEQVQWFECSSGGEWRASLFTNISALPGILCAPFVRNLVPLSALIEPHARRPTTLQICGKIEKTGLDLETFSIILSLSNHAVGGETPIADDQSSTFVDVIIKDLIIDQLIVTSSSEFWHSLNNGQRERRIAELVGTCYMMSVATSVNPDNYIAPRPLNVVTALALAPTVP